MRSTASRIPPLKREALELMARGPLAGRWNGGSRSGFSERAFNSHTIGWAVDASLATFNKGRTEARITQEGRDMLNAIMIEDFA